MKRKQRNNLRFRIACVIFVLIVGILYFLIYLAPKFSNAFVETYTAEFDTLDVDMTIDYLCVRDDRIHTADNSGTVKRTAKAGSLRTSGSKILTVGGVPYKSQVRGTVSYYYDGLEDVLTSENLKNLPKESLYPRKDDKGNESYKLKSCSKGTVSTGDVIFKIVDNSAWYLVTWLDPEEAAKLTEGSGVTIELDDKDKTQVRFRVSYIEPLTDETASTDTQASDTAQDASGEANENQPVNISGTKKDKLQVIFKCDRYYKRYSRLRYGTARVIISQKTGIVLETSSISEEDGWKGVYVKNKYGNYVFTPISIIAEVGDKTVVESRTFYDKDSDKIISTVKNYDSIKKGDGSGNVN